MRASLQDVNNAGFDDAVRAALMIDVIWFRNATFMPAVIEIEHTTGVTSGLTRMKNFQDRLPQFPTRWSSPLPTRTGIRLSWKATSLSFVRCARSSFHTLQSTNCIRLARGGSSRA